MKSKTLVSRILQLLYILVSLCMLLTFISCECEDGSKPAQTKPVSEDVKNELNIDTNDATDVNIAIGTRRLIGDDDTADSLVHDKRIKCRDYWSKAVGARADGDYDAAKKYFREALKWTPENEGELRFYPYWLSKSEIYDDLVSVSIGEAEKYKANGMDFDADNSYRDAADVRVEAAEHTTNPASIEYNYMRAADLYYRSGSIRDCCSYLYKAQELEEANFGGGLPFLKSDIERKIYEYCVQKVK